MSAHRTTRLPVVGALLVVFVCVLALVGGRAVGASSVADGHCPPGLVDAPGLEHGPGLSHAPGLSGGARGPDADPDCAEPPPPPSAEPEPTPGPEPEPEPVEAPREPPASQPVALPASAGGVPTVPRARPITASTRATPAEVPLEVAGVTEERSVVRDRARRSPRARVVASAAAPIESARSVLASSLLTLEDLDWDAANVGANVAIVLLLLLLTGLPAELCNSTLKAHYGQLAFGTRFPRLAAFGASVNALPNILLLCGFGLVGALIYGQLDPAFGLNRPSMILIGGLAVALVVVTAVFEALRIPYFRRRGGRHSHLQAFPLALVAAFVLVVVSRAFAIQPGFIFGVTCGLALSSEISEIEEGRSIAFASVGLIVLAVASWLCWTPIAAAATGDDPSTATLFLDVALSTVWVAGLQAVLFGLLPIRFLPGEKVVRWSRLGWGAIYGVALFLFVSIVAHPAASSLGDASSSALVPMLGLFVLFSGAACGVWAWFRFRPPSRSRDGTRAAPADDQVDCVT